MIDPAPKKANVPAAAAQPVETQPAAAVPPTEPEPHPVSSHRTPGEIARQESGAGGPSAEPQARKPVSPRKQAASKEDEHIRAAVQRSAHRDRKQSTRRPSTDPTRRSGSR